MSDVQLKDIIWSSSIASSSSVRFCNILSISCKTFPVSAVGSSGTFDAGFGAFSGSVAVGVGTGSFGFLWGTNGEAVASYFLGKGGRLGGSSSLSSEKFAVWEAGKVLC